ncbi:MAG: hypothetical protein JNK31_01075 [Candidatus Competibacter sp.]|nr:hypothetical protein [Candidatus Competibacter sp.]
MQRERAPSADSHEARFAALWNRAAAGASASAGSVYRRLARLYGESCRHYHTFDHIRRCLEEFDRAVSWADDPDGVELGLWFHDAIYRPGAPDNERRSAILFQECSSGCEDVRLQQQVCDLILATTHRKPLDRRDEQLIADIDLSSFGLNWEAFELDGRRIRAEFEGVSDSRYYAGLLRFLRGLQNRPTFFYTDYFQQRHESNARANLQRLVENLSARGYSAV